MKRYKTGYLVELRARDELKKMGAKVVVRSARSLTPIDLIAIFPDKREIWIVQCKAKQEAPKRKTSLKKKFKELTELEGVYYIKPYVYMKKEGKYKFISLRRGE